MPDPAPFTVNRKVMNRVDLVATSGRIDAMTASVLEQYLKDCLHEEHYRIIVDLAGTEYISSAGLKVLVATLKEAKRHRGDVRLANMTRNLKDTFSLVGLVPELFKVYDDVVEAVGSF
jgi:anti-sigma B factor antagonist